MNPTEFVDGLIVAARILGMRGHKRAEVGLLVKAAEQEPRDKLLQNLFINACKIDDIATAVACSKQLLSKYPGETKWSRWLEREATNRVKLRLLAEETKGPTRPTPPIVPVDNKMMYVLHSSLPYSSNGYATRGQGVAKGLVANKVDLVCVTRPGFPTDIEKLSKTTTFANTSTVDGITYHHIAKPSRLQLRNAAAYMKASKQALERAIEHHKPSVVMAASNYATALPACLAARRFGLPFIYEVRGFWEITRLSRESNFIKTKVYEDQLALEIATAQAATCVITLTKAMATLLVQRGVSAEKIFLLPNSYDPKTFRVSPRNHDLAASLDIPDGVPVIGYIGSFVHYEGLADLTEACGALAARDLDFRLLLVGSESAVGQDRGQLTKDILNTAQRLGFFDKLLLTGRVPHEEVPDYYSLIDICPFPRVPLPVTELVSPLKPIEALALGKAVVVSSVGGLHEMIVDGETGLVFEKGNIDALAASLVQLVSDPALRQQLSSAGQTWAKQHRQWEQSVGFVLGEMYQSPCQILEVNN